MKFIVISITTPIGICEITSDFVHIGIGEITTSDFNISTHQSEITSYFEKRKVRISIDTDPIDGLTIVFQP